MAGDVWNLMSASIVCKQLDCGSAVNTEMDYIEHSDQPVWSLTSTCVGSESALRDCGRMESETSHARLEVICSGDHDLTCLTKPHLPHGLTSQWKL